MKFLGRYLCSCWNFVRNHTIYILLLFLIIPIVDMNITPVEFLRAVINHWYVLFAGILMFLFEVYQKVTGKSISKGVFWKAGIICLMIAMFLAWQDEHNEKDKLISEKTKIESQQPIAKLPFDLQIKEAKDRIRYLSEKFLKTDTMSLIEVTGAYGNHFLGNPNLYDWNKVMIELERQGYIKIIEYKGNNIVFRVLK